VDCAQRGMLVCSKHPGRAGVKCSNWCWGSGRQVDNLDSWRDARTCAPCGPSRLQHVVRDLSDAQYRARYLDPENVEVCPCQSGIGTLHLQALGRLCYTPLHPLRSREKAETVATECYMVPQAHCSSEKKTVGPLALHIFLTSFDNITPVRR
jgi:hypothetical protein